MLGIVPHSSFVYVLLQDTVQETQAWEAAEKFVEVYYNRLDKQRHVSDSLRAGLMWVVTVTIVAWQ